jgi:glucosamine--fructose-6-phosphate aminotransferase (isomerizing)
MCGIFGIVTKEEEQLGPILVEAGRRLSYRGYDSVGCATLHKASQEITIRKDVGKIDDVSARLKFEEMTGSRGIVQLRWATFGNPSQANAQPHLDSDGDSAPIMAVVNVGFAKSSWRMVSLNERWRDLRPCG